MSSDSDRPEADPQETGERKRTGEQTPDGRAAGDPDADGPVTDADHDPTTGGGTENSGPNRSVLNRAAIRRFTEGVLTTYDGTVNRESNGRWSVTIPDPLVPELGYEHATFVFDADDRTVGSDDVVVAPGTRVFSALCALAGQSASRSEPGPGSASASNRSTDTRAETGTERTDRVDSLHLSGDVLQLHVPPALDAAGFETTIEAFSPRGEERALAFHFRAQFTSVRSYQREESVTIVVDPATRSVLPTLAARLTSHLPRLLDPSTEDDGDDERGYREETDPFDRETVRGAYATAKTAAVDAVKPTAETLRETEEAAMADRVAEIREYYDHRRAELADRVDAKRADVEEYSAKYDRAQGDETRLRYLREQREAEDELASLTERVEDEKEELRNEERARIAEETERHRVDVDLELERVTDLTYERGRLSLSVTEGNVTARPTVSYVPATDEHYGLDCAACGTDLLDDRTPADRLSDDRTADGRTVEDLPRLCVGGYLVCEGCARTCRSCGETRCGACLDAGTANRSLDDSTGDRAATATEAGTGAEREAERGVDPEVGQESTGEIAAGVETFETCSLCREHVCRDCAVSCTVCDERVCSDHRTECALCAAATCIACGEPCAICEEFHCDAHLVEPTDAVGDGRLYCEAHAEACTQCGDVRGVDAIEYCSECDEPFCGTHRHGCRVCGETLCRTHAVACAHCADSTSNAEAAVTFCGDHAEHCAAGGEVVCEAHSRPGVIVDGWVCDDHRAACGLCGVEYAESGFEDGRCPACTGLSAETPAEPPVAAIAEEFPTTRIGTTPTHAVIHGKKRLRRDEIVVVDRRTGEEVGRFKADFFSKLSGEL